MSTDQKIDKLVEHVLEMKGTLAENTVTLNQNTKDMAEHIRRTNILETQMRRALFPIDFFTALAKVIAVIAATTGLVWSIVQLVRVFTS